MCFVGSSAEKEMDGSTLPGSMSRTNGEKGTEHVFSPPMSSRSDFVITRKRLIHNSIDESKKPSLKPSLKSGIGYVKTESRSKTPPPRRNISSQPRHNTPQPRRKSREPIHQNFYPMNWNNHQSQVCLRTCLEPDEWIKDSGCSKHMTGNKSLFSTYKAYDRGNVVFGSNLKGKIKGKGSSIIAIRTDHGREFDNEVQFEAYCDAQGITHNFSAPCTPQYNGVVDRKNRTLQEMSRTMLNEQSIP
ncbi:retrovirus-related pol polyprotein from transposon TNT 1-94 [Tanacetum coccineum]